ncbi:MAG: thiamine-phosphate kinase [Pirellulales bacterium]|nr:thiamine-phosphate kinase [Pirellulales bacterium]
MEREFLDWLRSHTPCHPCAKLGLNDDAALVSLAGRDEVVVTTDLLTDAVDFQLDKHEPRRIGRQALAANLSDLAAMAAKPLAAFVSLALPRGGGAGYSALELAIALCEGIIPLAAEFDMALAGGDTNTYDGPLALSVTALGTTTGHGPLTRSAGQPGDWLIVTGPLGGSILGHMLDFTPRVREAILLHERYDLHAAIDISDGLALDASRLAAASGCGAVLNLDCIPISQDAIALAESEIESRSANTCDLPTLALRHALGDGQDFELLIAADPTTARQILEDRPINCELAHVGKLVPEPGLWHQLATGDRSPLEPTGWQH